MARTQYEILVANYGSGKTEISLNMALDAVKEGKKVALVDLDIVNPYFRSSAKRAVLEDAGVKVIASEFANTPIDLPLVAAETARIFKDEFDLAIVDVGGDPVGATALGRYKEEFSRLLDRLNTNFVINASRPQTMNLEDIRVMFDLIESRSRLKMKWLINNTNLAYESSGQNLLDGQKLVENVSKTFELPIRYIVGKQQVLDEFAKLAGEEGFKYQGELRPITPLMRQAWMDTQLHTPRTLPKFGPMR